MTERFAIICHGTWKQCCLVNLTLVTTGLPGASCQIYCRLLPAGIDVACACFLQILSYFPFFFMLLQPRVSGKVRQRTHWKQKSSLTSTRTPLHSSPIPVFRMLAGAWPTHTASHAELWQDGAVRVKQTQVCWTQGGNHQTHLPFTETRLQPRPEEWKALTLTIDSPQWNIMLQPEPLWNWNDFDGRVNGGGFN